MDRSGATTQPQPPARGSFWTPTLLALLLAAHGVLGLTSLARNSVTIDEFSHLPAGLSYWQKGTFALYHHNPPLVKMLAAAVILPERPVVDYEGTWKRTREAGSPPNHVAFATEFMQSNARRYQHLFNRARGAILLLSVAGGFLVFQWARDLWGRGGGLLAAALWALDPNLLAHAGVVTTDSGATVAIFAATYAFWRWLRVPTWRRAFLAGAALGGAQIVKFSALMLYALLPILALVSLLFCWRSRRRSTLPGAQEGSAVPSLRPTIAAAQGATILALSLLVINAGYGFEGTGRPLGSFAFLSPDLTVPRTHGTPPYDPSPVYQAIYRTRQNRFEGTWLAALPAPLPEHYVLGFDEQRFESNSGFPGAGYAVYLRGEVRRTGWRTYYLWALALKVPLGTWLLVLAALVLPLFLPGLRAAVVDEICWALPVAAIVAGMSLMTGLDLGVRYVLPVLPFAFVGMGRLVRLFEGRAWSEVVATCLLTAALLWNAVAASLTWPRYLSYFNELAGGPAGGHRYLLDSNLDWGQGLLDLRRWLDAHPEAKPLALAYFGAVDPSIYGIRYRLPPRDPRVVPPDDQRPGEIEGLQPGAYAVSVNFVQGLPHIALSEDGTVVPVDQDAFGYFRRLRPAARAGDSIWIYRLGERDVARIVRLWREGPGPPGE